MITRQIPWIVLPQGATSPTDIEEVQDALVHDSIVIPCWSLQEKVLHLFATEIVIAPGIGNLSVTAWLSPDGTNFTQVGVPSVLVASGVMLTAHSVMLPWTMHSEYAMLRVQAVAATALSYWAVVGLFSGKGP